MALNTNTTGATELSAVIQTYYDKKLIQDMQPKLVHYQYGQKRSMPSGSGKTVQFRKYAPFPAATTELAEGTPPNGRALTVSSVSETVKQYGDFVAISDLLSLTALDPVINETVELCANQGALTVDEVTREVLHAGDNVMYAGDKTSRGAMTVGDKLTTTELRKAVRKLKKANAQPFIRGNKPWYIAIVGPETTFDLQDDPRWVNVTNYQDKEKIYSGEIGRIFGVIVVETSQAKVFQKAGSGSGEAKADVHSTLVFGQNAYGVVDIDNSANVKTIIKPAGAGGSSDPLDQISTVGWKVMAYCTKILQPEWLIRIEHGASAQ